MSSAINVSLISFIKGTNAFIRSFTFLTVAVSAPGMLKFSIVDSKTLSTKEELCLDFCTAALFKADLLYRLLANNAGAVDMVPNRFSTRYSLLISTLKPTNMKRLKLQGIIC